MPRVPGITGESVIKQREDGLGVHDEPLSRRGQPDRIRRRADVELVPFPAQHVGELLDDGHRHRRQEFLVVAGRCLAAIAPGLELTIDAQPVVAGALEAGLIVNRTAERVVRMLPPFTVTA